MSAVIKSRVEVVTNVEIVKHDDERSTATINLKIDGDIDVAERRETIRGVESTETAEMLAAVFYFYFGTCVQELIAARGEGVFSDIKIQSIAGRYRAEIRGKIKIADSDMSITVAAGDCRDVKSARQRALAVLTAAAARLVDDHHDHALIAKNFRRQSDTPAWIGYAASKL
jgi:hypothetical protein